MSSDPPTQTGAIQSGHPADEEGTEAASPTRRRVLRAGAALAATGVVDTAAADHTTNDGCDTAVQANASITINDQVVGDDCGDLTDSPDNVTIASATLSCPNGGFIDVHHNTMPVGPSGSFPPGYPVGATEILPGKTTVQNVCIDLFEGEGAFGTCIDWDNSEWPVDGNADGTAPMLAMLHLDTDENDLFTHYCQHESATAGTDHAYLASVDPKKPVVDKAQITGDGPG